jgi:hypothetical protein
MMNPTDDRIEKGLVKEPSSKQLLDACASKQKEKLQAVSTACNACHQVIPAIMPLALLHSGGSWHDYIYKRARLSGQEATRGYTLFTLSCRQPTCNMEVHQCDDSFLPCK